MFYEEKMIDGVLHWRGTPTGDWQPVSPRELAEKSDEVEPIYCLQTGQRLAIIEGENGNFRVVTYWPQHEAGQRIYTAPPAPVDVDVRVPMSRIIELLARLVNAPQTDDEFDADVIRRDFVMEKVMQLRMAWDELSKAQRAPLDGQPAGVVIDDAMVKRAEAARVKSLNAIAAYGSAGVDERHLMAMRSGLQAAIGGGVRS